MASDPVSDHRAIVRVPDRTPGPLASLAQRTLATLENSEAGAVEDSAIGQFRFPMHGLNEIVRVLGADPEKAEDFANSMRDRADQEGPATEQTRPADYLTELVQIWLSSLAPAERADFGRVMRQAAEDLRVKRDAEALAAHVCLAHPDCGPVTALGQSGHGHHSDVTGMWCWHFTDSFLGGRPLDPPPPRGSNAAKRRALCCIDGDPSIHKTYPTAGPLEGFWLVDFAVAAGLTARRASVTASPS